MYFWVLGTLCSSMGHVLREGGWDAGVERSISNLDKQYDPC